MRIFSAFILSIMLFFLAEPLFAKSTTDDVCAKECCGKKPDDKNKCPGICNPFFSCVYCQYIPQKKVEIKNIDQSFSPKFLELNNQNIKEGYLLSCWKPPNTFQGLQTI